MTLVRMLRGGQVTLPAEARRALRVAEGGYLDLEVTGGAVTLKPVTIIDRAEADRRLDSILGRVKYVGPEPPPSEEQIMDVVMDEVHAARARSFPADTAVLQEIGQIKHSSDVAGKSGAGETGSHLMGIFNTDSEWLDVLRNHNVHNNVNFWQKDKRQIHLPGGSRFYFKLRSSRFIAGRAVFRQQVTMSMREAWDTFGINNGALSFDALRQKAQEALHVVDDSLECLVLDEVELLDPGEYPQLGRKFVAMKNPKYFQEGDLPAIESAFSESIGVTRRKN